VVMTAFGLTAHWQAALCVLAFLLGNGFAAAPAVQSRLMDVAREGQTLAAASMHSAFNIANAIGAWLGGLVIAEGFGYPATGYVGAALSLFGLCVFAVLLRLDRTAKAR
jgi:DHA1 family inner membrane transport protein